MCKSDKKIVILGANGMLGSDIVKILSHDYKVFPLTMQDADITDKGKLKKLMKQICPDIIINCAAYTDVDGAESNAEKAFLINAEGVKNISECCKDVNSGLIHYSTDYIFDGDKEGLYDELDLPCPLNVYGWSKLRGERYIEEILEDYLIIRSSWLFGENGKNFITSILKLCYEKDGIRIVNDQIGSPTYTIDLSKATELLIARNASGIFNVTNSGYCSWFDFAKEILKLSGAGDVSVTPISADELNRPAVRPKNSMLNCNKFCNITDFQMPDYRTALINYLKEINEKAGV